jgi:DNA-binding response OmpR family regulator
MGKPPETMRPGMEAKRVLIVDDEKNIRFTLPLALDPLGLETDTAGDGEEALRKLREKEFALILLDLKMPGMDGIEVLRQVRKIRPDIPVIMITAYGTIENSVEAMKIGAVDFISKPFTPERIRDLVCRVLDRSKRDEEKAVIYASCIQLGRRSIEEGHTEAAVEHARRAISIDPERPEAFNLLGAILEVGGDRGNAQMHYRAALSLDPSYEPAQTNLSRSTSWKPTVGPILLGSAKEEASRPALNDEEPAGQPKGQSR